MQRPMRLAQCGKRSGASSCCARTAWSRPTTGSSTRASRRLTSPHTATSASRTSWQCACARRRGRAGVEGWARARRRPPVCPAPRHTHTHALTRTHAHALPPSLPQVTLDGHTGEQARFMGVYALSEVRANGAPRFVKRLAGGGAHYLYRTSGGRWGATANESAIAKNAGPICSSRAADLPSEAGLGWQYYDGSAWQDDPNLRCTEVTGPAAAPSRRARGGEGASGAKPLKPGSVAPRAKAPPPLCAQLHTLSQPAP